MASSLHHAARAYIGQDGKIHIHGGALVADESQGDLAGPDSSVPTLAALPTGASAGGNAKWLRLEDEAGNAYWLAAWSAT